MSVIRVFLLTCRRQVLLPRALKSLQSQTFTNWTCELHNDAPEDESPRKLVEQIGDPRITLYHHETNWGAVRNFNHAFAGGPEPYLALLEDDNWWEPEFLAKAYAALESTPAANAVWSNQRLWREEANGTWTNTRQTIWRIPSESDRKPRIFHWPEPLQCFDAIHSHGALLMRTQASRHALVPHQLPLAIIEPARERLLSGRWIFLPDVLGNFALTRSTARSQDRGLWMQSQLLVAASYLEAAPMNSSDIAMLWHTLRNQTPPATPLLFHLAFAGVQTGSLLRNARFAEWLCFVANAIRHPATLLRSLRFRSDNADVWAALSAGAKARSAESLECNVNPLWTKDIK